MSVTNASKSTSPQDADQDRTSGCLSIPAACCPTLALSIFAVTTSSRSNALSIPVAAKTSGSGCFSSDVSLPLAWLESSAANPPPAAIAPGPAGLGAFAADFFAPAFGLFFGLELVDASSSAKSLAFSALRANSARLLSSLSSFALLDLAPSCHLSASFRS